MSQKINEQIQKIYGELEDLKTEKKEKVKLLVKLVKEAAWHPGLANSPNTCRIIVYLQNILNDFKALEKDQDEHRDVLMGKLSALRKEREELKNDS